MTDKEQKRIFIGGLVTAVTEKELLEKFSRFGEVGQIEIKTRNSDLDTKTFAYLNLTAGENEFKKCFTAYNNTKWKGGQLKLQFAKESFLSKLKEEREEAEKKEEKDSAPAEVKKSPALEVYNGKAVPGTLLDEEGKWVMGKYSRVLPVLRVKNPSSKQVVTLDPSKTLHALKKLKSDDITESSAKSADLTWQMDVNDNDITKRRQGEFPAWDPPKKESLFSRLQSLAAEEHVSDTEMEVVPVGKTSAKPKPAALISNAYDSSDSADSADKDEIVTKASGKKSHKTPPAKPTLKDTPKKDTKSNHGNSLASASSDAAEKAGTKILQKKKQKVQSSNPTPKNTTEKDRNTNSTLDNDSDSAGSADTDEIISRALHKKSAVTKPSNTSDEVGQSKTVSAKTRNGKGYSSGDSDSSEDQLQTLKSKTLSKKKEKEEALKSPVKNKGLTSPTVSSGRKQAKVHKSQLNSDDSKETESKPKLMKFAKPKPTSDSSDSDVDVSEEEIPKPCDAKKSAKATQSSALDARKPTVSDSSASEPDSDSSDTVIVKRPQFQFVKTATTQSKCLRKSTQSKTPPFKGLSMLSSDDEMEVGKPAQSTTYVEKRAADSIGKSAVTVKQASKIPKKDLKGNSPSSRDVPLDVKPGSGRKAVDGVAFIQKSHQARQKNLEEVKKQENLITKSIREGTGSKHVKFSDSDEEGSSKKQQPVEAETKAAPALFDDSASEEEGDSKADHDFSIRPQFEGKKGQKLMELQTKIKDSRFRMDDRFAESDSDKEEEKEEAEKDPDEIELAEEKARNLKILEQVLGFKPRQRKKDNIYQGIKRYLDPVQSKHLEITPETAIVSKQKKRKLDSEAEPETKTKTTEDNTKFDSSDDKSEAEDDEEKSSEDGGDDDKEDEDEKDTDESSEEEEDEAVEEEETSDDDEEEENKKKGIKAKAAAQDEEETADTSNKSNLGDLFAGGSSFTFFGAPVSESSDEEEAEMKSTESTHIITPAKAAVQVEDKEEETEEEEMEVQSKEVGPAVREKDRDAEQPSFMISKDDPRLRAAVRFFKRPAEEEFEELVAEWPDQRHNIMQIVRDRHKRALRKERQTQRQEQWKRKHSWKKSRK